MNQNVEIIYEDNDLVVCRKMSGIAVHTAKLVQQDLEGQLRNYFAAKGEENTQVFVIHRLDQPVEGVMVFARNKRVAAELSRQSRERNMSKCYLALAQGVFAEPTGVLEDYLLQDKKKNTSQVVKQGTQGAKYARLKYEVERVYKAEDFSDDSQMGKQDRQISKSLQPYRDISLVRVQLDTGRHHQIRVQMAHAGHPLIGDRKYNPGPIWGYFPVGLCAVKIAFVHPTTGKNMEFEVKPRGQAFQFVCQDHIG